MKALGQYKCGCSYGPIKKSKRLKYCSVHGESIQDEYPYIEHLITDEEVADAQARRINGCMY